MKSSSEGRRKSRVEKEVQAVVSEFIIHHMKNDIPGLVTVTRVQMPADFRGAQVYVTYFDAVNPDAHQTFDVVAVLQSWASDIQDEITEKLKMRYCPKIKFFYDDAVDQILKIEKILSNLSPNSKVVALDEMNELGEDDGETH